MSGYVDRVPAATASFTGASRRSDPNQHRHVVLVRQLEFVVVSDLPDDVPVGRWVGRCVPVGDDDDVLAGAPLDDADGVDDAAEVAVAGDADAIEVGGVVVGVLIEQFRRRR
ncbi:MAG: hypothetical protein AB7G11_14430 [Phycisphaerales bacterium]